MGRSMVYAVITSEDNMKALGRYKDIARRLALARGLDNKEAAQMAADGKAVVWIDVGIHASECAPAQHALQLAYDLITSDDKDTRLILDNTILLLVFANPDGMTLVADWYRANLGTPYETSSMPWLYHKYAGHDNNRDSYMNNLKETRAITRLVNHEWFPVIFYDHHQTAPFPARIWIPPAAEPTNPNLHPLFVRGKNLVGSAMGYAFDREEKEGAISRINFDFIYPTGIPGLHDRRFLSQPLEGRLVEIAGCGGVLSDRIQIRSAHGCFISGNHALQQIQNGQGYYRPV